MLIIYVTRFFGLCLVTRATNKQKLEALGRIMTSVSPHVPIRPFLSTSMDDLLHATIFIFDIMY